MIGDQLGHHPIDARGIGNVELLGHHSGIRRDHGFEMAAPGSRDDDPIAKLVKGLGEPAAGTRSVAGDGDVLPESSWV
ncbi:MAG: hypothetical protein QOH39_1104 [Verrucomicrobiota bacterium]